MLEKIKNIPGNKIVVFSSFFYIITAMLLSGKDNMVVSFLFLVFLTCLFYHSYPKNIYFRVADWLASGFFAFYLIHFIYTHNFIDNTLHLTLASTLLILSIISWVISLFFDREKNNLAYTLSHVFWHILSSIVIYIIVSSVAGGIL